MPTAKIVNSNSKDKNTNNVTQEQQDSTVSNAAAAVGRRTRSHDSVTQDVLSETIPKKKSRVVMTPRGLDRSQGLQIRGPPLKSSFRYRAHGRGSGRGRSHGRGRGRGRIHSRARKSGRGAGRGKDTAISGRGNTTTNNRYDRVPPKTGTKQPRKDRHEFERLRKQQQNNPISSEKDVTELQETIKVASVATHKTSNAAESGTSKEQGDTLDKPIKKKTKRGTHGKQRSYKKAASLTLTTDNANKSNEFVKALSSDNVIVDRIVVANIETNNTTLTSIQDQNDLSTNLHVTQTSAQDQNEVPANMRVDKTFTVLAEKTEKYAQLKSASTTSSTKQHQGMNTSTSVLLSDVNVKNADVTKTYSLTEKVNQSVSTTESSKTSQNMNTVASVLQSNINEEKENEASTNLTTTKMLPTKQLKQSVSTPKSTKTSQGITASASVFQSNANKEKEDSASTNSSTKNETVQQAMNRYEDANNMKTDETDTNKNLALTYSTTNKDENDANKLVVITQDPKQVVDDHETTSSTDTTTSNQSSNLNEIVDEKKQPFIHTKPTFVVPDDAKQLFKVHDSTSNSDNEYDSDYSKLNRQRLQRLINIKKTVEADFQKRTQVFSDSSEDESDEHNKVTLANLNIVSNQSSTSKGHNSRSTVASADSDVEENVDSDDDDEVYIDTKENSDVKQINEKPKNQKTKKPKIKTKKTQKRNKNENNKGTSRLDILKQYHNFSCLTTSKQSMYSNILNFVTNMQKYEEDLQDATIEHAYGPLRALEHIQVRSDTYTFKKLCTSTCAYVSINSKQAKYIELENQEYEVNIFDLVQQKLLELFQEATDRTGIQTTFDNNAIRVISIVSLKNTSTEDNTEVHVVASIVFEFIHTGDVKGLYVHYLFSQSHLMIPDVFGEGIDVNSKVEGLGLGSKLLHTVQLCGLSVTRSFHVYLCSNAKLNPYYENLNFKKMAYDKKSDIPKDLVTLMDKENIDVVSVDDIDLFQCTTWIPYEKRNFYQLTQKYLSTIEYTKGHQLIANMKTPRSYANSVHASINTCVTNSWVELFKLMPFKAYISLSLYNDYMKETKDDHGNTDKVKHDTYLMDDSMVCMRDYFLKFDKFVLKEKQEFTKETRTKTDFEMCIARAPTLLYFFTSLMYLSCTQTQSNGNIKIDKYCIMCGMCKTKFNFDAHGDFVSLSEVHERINNDLQHLFTLITMLHFCSYENLPKESPFYNQRHQILSCSHCTDVQNRESPLCYLLIDKMHDDMVQQQQCYNWIQLLATIFRFGAPHILRFIEVKQKCFIESIEHYTNNKIRITRNQDVEFVSDKPEGFYKETGRYASFGRTKVKLTKEELRIRDIQDKLKEEKLYNDDFTAQLQLRSMEYIDPETRLPNKPLPNCSKNLKVAHFVGRGINDKNVRTEAIWDPKFFRTAVQTQYSKIRLFPEVLVNSFKVYANKECKLTAKMRQKIADSVMSYDRHDMTKISQVKYHRGKKTWEGRTFADIREPLSVNWIETNLAIPWKSWWKNNFKDIKNPTTANVWISLPIGKSKSKNTKVRGLWEQPYL